MEWKTIEKDGYPEPGSFVICHTKHEFNSWCDYSVYYYGRHKGFPKNAFWLYDLLIENKSILGYQVLEKNKKI